MVTGALATAAAAAIAAWVTTRALKPVTVLAQTATDWSEHDLSRRFDLGEPTNEITALAATLDTLLDKVSAAIHAEQRLTASCSLAHVVEDVRHQLEPDGTWISVSVAEHEVGAPHAVAVRALTPVVANALRFADSRVAISATASATRMVHLFVEDDGPGVSGDSREIFEPGVTSAGGSGAGLGLSISRRMARSVGGDLELDQAGPPARFLLRLPLA